MLRKLLIILFICVVPLGSISYSDEVLPSSNIVDIAYRSLYTIYSTIEDRKTHELGNISCRANLDRVEGREAWGTTAGHCVRDEDTYTVRETYILYTDGWRKQIYITKIFSDLDQAEFYIPDIGATAWTGTRPPIPGEKIFTFLRPNSQDFFDPYISKDIEIGYVGPELEITEYGEGLTLFKVCMTNLLFRHGMSGGGVYAVSDGRRVGSVTAFQENGFEVLGYFTPVTH